MTTPDYPAGTPNWLEVFTHEPDRAAEFYSALFGWEVQDSGPDFGNYRTFHLGGRLIAGCMTNTMPPEVPNVWFTYFSTPDAAATVAAARAVGSDIQVEPEAIGDMGTMAVLSDTAGAMIGLWQPGSLAGVEVLGEVGTPSWFELHTLHYAAALTFYRDVLHWDLHTMSDEPHFRYSTYGSGDSQRAGIMDAAGTLPPGVPSHWAVYFGVTDTGAAARQTVELGGHVHQGAEDTPYGRIATLADPTGAMFRVREVSSSHVG